jgi:hypothetical protein
MFGSADKSEGEQGNGTQCGGETICVVHGAQRLKMEMARQIAKFTGISVDPAVSEGGLDPVVSDLQWMGTWKPLMKRRFS